MLRNAGFLFSAAVLLLLSCNSYATQIYTFSLIPSSGNLRGPAGSTVGWGYEIKNDSTTDWLVTDAINAGLFEYATLDSGDYFDFPVIGPGQTDTVDFAAAGKSGFGSGLAALTWANNAPLGFVNGGDFDLSACWATSSTSACVADAPDEFAAYSATVVNTPEPPSKGYLAIALATFGAAVLLSLRRPAFST